MSPRVKPRARLTIIFSQLEALYVASLLAPLHHCFFPRSDLPLLSSKPAPIDPALLALLAPYNITMSDDLLDYEAIGSELMKVS